MTRLRQEQEQLNVAVGIWRDLSFGIGSAWSSALRSVAEGTQSVSQAFAAMGKAILDTMADIAAQQATMALFKLGAGLLTAGLTGGMGAGVGGGPVGGVGAGIEPIMFQHGGRVDRPTLAILGEAGPEHVVPQREMQAMQAAMQGGGRPPINLSVIHVANQAQANQEKANAEAKGHEAIIVNAVNANLGLGESSSILRTLRTLQR